MITEYFSESDQAASARSVYLALTELASDNGGERFTATKALIAHRAGLSISTTERLLKGFEQKNLVAITRNRIGAWKQPNTYTLLTIRNGDATLRIGRSRSNPDRARKKGKESKEQGKGAHAPLRSERTVSVFVPKVPYPETEDEMYETLERLGIEPNPDYDGNFFEQMESSGWTIQDEPVFDWPKTYQRRLELTLPL